jgi:hypothetical protein
MEPEKEEKHPKPLLKHHTKNKESEKDEKKDRKSIMWDNKTIEEQYEERRLHPCQKIDEPKTPYIPYEKGDDEYLKKVTEVNKIEGTEDVLNDVINQLKNVKNETQKEEEFLEKRHKVYANEFKEAQKFREEHEKDDEKIRNELEEKTINNTLINKFAGKINLDKNDEK